MEDKKEEKKESEVKLTKDEFNIIIQALYNSNVRVADAPMILRLIEKILKIKQESQKEETQKQKK
jgi:hypothetical protein